MYFIMALKSCTLVPEHCKLQLKYQIVWRASLSPTSSKTQMQFYGFTSPLLEQQTPHCHVQVSVICKSRCCCCRPSSCKTLKMFVSWSEDFLNDGAHGCGNSHVVPQEPLQLHSLEITEWNQSCKIIRLSKFLRFANGGKSRITRSTVTLLCWLNECWEMWLGGTLL